MAGLKGVANIADDDHDDHGWDLEEHDRNLIEALERLQEKNLTSMQKSAPSE